MNKEKNKQEQELIKQEHLVGLLEDLKLSEEKLREEKDFIDSVLNNIPDMVFVKNAKDFTFEEMNLTGQKLLGLKKDKILGKNLLEKFSKSQADFFLAKDKEVIKSGKLLDIPEESINTPHGTRILHTKKIPIFDKKGKPLYLLGISEDITEKKMLEEKIRKRELVVAGRESMVNGRKGIIRRLFKNRKTK